MVKRKEEVEYMRNLLNSTMEMWGAMVGSIVAEVVGKYGEEGRKLVMKASYDIGKWQAEKTAKQIGAFEKGGRALVKYGYPTEGAVVGDNGVSVVFAPKLWMTLTKSMSKGDPYCTYSWKEVKSARKSKRSVK